MTKRTRTGTRAALLPTLNRLMRGRAVPRGPKRSDEINDAINMLSNNQRHHWSRAGRPLSVKKIAAFSNLVALKYAPELAR